MLTRAEMLAIIAGGGSVSWNGLILSLAAHVPTDQEIADVAAARAAAAPATQGDIDAGIDAAIADLELAPFADSTAIVKGSGDATKGIRFEVDGLTAGATRVITPPDANTTLPIATQPITFSGLTAPRTITLPDAAATLARTDAAQTFTGPQVFEVGVAGASPAVFRQTGGVAGTDEVQIGHNGTDGVIDAKNSAGNLKLQVGGGAAGYMSLGAAGALTLYGGARNLDTQGIRFYADTAIDLHAGVLLAWNSGGAYGSRDTGLARVSAGVAEVNTGTAGVLAAFRCASLNLGGATLLDVLYAAAALDFGNIVAGASADLTITVTGAVAGDTVELGRPAAEDGGLVTTAIVTGADTVTVRAKNTNLVAAVDQASLTYKATVFRI